MDAREKARQDLWSRENSRKKKDLATLALMGSAGASAFGAFKGKHTLALGGVLGAVGAGALRGRAARDEDAALHRLRKYYDLREPPRFINFDAVNPSEKVAMNKEAFYASIASLLGHLAIGAPSVVPALTFAGDALATPQIGNWAMGATRRISQIAAKQKLGRKLTPGESFAAGITNIATGTSQAVEKIKSPWIRKPLSYLTGLAGPFRKGGEWGEAAGAGLKEVGKVSKRYQELGLEALTDEKPLINTIKRDAKTFHSAWENLSENTRVGKFLKSRGAPTGQSALSRYLEDPSLATKDVEKFRKLEDAAVSGAVTGAAALGVGAGANLMAQRRKKHPLAKKDLPNQLADLYPGLRLVPPLEESQG